MRSWLRNSPESRWTLTHSISTALNSRKHALTDPLLPVAPPKPALNRFVPTPSTWPAYSRLMKIEMYRPTILSLATWTYSPAPISSSWRRISRSTVRLLSPSPRDENKTLIPFRSMTSCRFTTTISAACVSQPANPPIPTSSSRRPWMFHVPIHTVRSFGEAS